MKLSKKEIKKFQKEILDWYKKNKRDLPWRVLYDTRLKRDPYKILVSEMMAQQTQLSRVIPKYLEWMKRFPTLEDLAKAQTKDVLKYWNGLGYNRRALYLQKTAQEIVIRYSFTVHGKKEIRWPETEEELRKLPGIGEYTAGAILCFAFNKQIAVVDTNVRRVILTRIQNSKLKSQNFTNKEIQEIADVLLPKGKAYEWNQALMDYSSAVLKNEKISIPKQSYFKTSNRFYRGQVIRLLLKKSQIAKSLFNQLENNGISQKEFEKVLIQMEKDGLVVKEGNKISLP